LEPNLAGMFPGWSSTKLLFLVFENKGRKVLKFDEKREITPKWVMGFTSIAGWVDLDMPHIFAI
jgi:hypothetical protein